MGSAYAILDAPGTAMGHFLNAGRAGRMAVVPLGDIDARVPDDEYEEIPEGDPEYDPEDPDSNWRLSTGSRRARAWREAEVLADTLAAMRRAGMTDREMARARVVVWDGRSAEDRAEIYPGAAAPFVDVLDWDGQALWEAARRAAAPGGGPRAEERELR